MAPRRRAARRRVPGPAADPMPDARAGARVAVPPPAGPAQLVPPAGYQVALATEVRAGKALVGNWVLYCWPAEGWMRDRVVRVSRAAGFSHVVGYGPTSALGAAAVTSLLDAAAHGPVGRWVLLLPTRSAGLCFSGMVVMGLRAGSESGPQLATS